MKFSTVRNLGSVLLLVGSLAGHSAASADEDKEHGSEEPQAGAPAANAGSKQKIPASPEGVWKAIDQEVAELDKTIQGGALDEVHHHAFAIRDLVAALPERSKSLPAERLAKVQGNVKYVATLAQRLDATGDAKDKAGTQANFDKLKKVLEGLRANYMPAK